jgi:hypothetical protein
VLALLIQTLALALDLLLDYALFSEPLLLFPLAFFLDGDLLQVVSRQLRSLTLSPW